MLNFLMSNAATVIVLAVVAFFVFLAIRKIVKDRKSGIGPCGQKCADCPHAATCHKVDEQSIE